MIYANIELGDNVSIDPTSTINNAKIGDRVKIAKRVSVFGSEKYQLIIGSGTYIGMNCILNGYNNQLTIGENVSFAQNVNVMVDSGPNASEIIQRIFPIISSAVSIGDHCWIGASAIIMPGVKLGKFCVVGAFSFVKDSFPDYSIIGGCPAKLLRTLTNDEIKVLCSES